MINPITQMKADVTTARVLQNELHQTLKNKQRAVQNFYREKEKAESQVPVIEPPPAPKFSVMADKEKEAELLKLAKAEYECYEDVGRFAKMLNLRAGIVYLTLKHHGFIKQTETTQYRVLDSYYRNNGNLKAITQDTGLTVWICAKTLEQLDIAPNWHGYLHAVKSNSANAIGSAAEEEFLRLVPFALDMNRQYQMNNPTFDFVINEKTIDIKSGALSFASGMSKDGNYKMRVNNEHPDFYCFFAIQDKEKDVTAGNYRILLIPSVVIPEGKTSIYISHNETAQKNSSLYWDFEVQPAALATMLENI